MTPVLSSLQLCLTLAGRGAKRHTLAPGHAQMRTIKPCLQALGKVCWLLSGTGVPHPISTRSWNALCPAFPSFGVVSALGGGQVTALFLHSLYLIPLPKLFPPYFLGFLPRFSLCFLSYPVQCRLPVPFSFAMPLSSIRVEADMLRATEMDVAMPQTSLTLQDEPQGQKQVMGSRRISC